MDDGTKKAIEKAIDEMAAKWPSNLVCRKAIGEFTGGAIAAKTIANEDSAGTGPSGRFLLANQTVYPVANLVEWLKTRAATRWETRKSASKA